MSENKKTIPYVRYYCDYCKEYLTENAKACDNCGKLTNDSMFDYKMKIFQKTGILPEDKGDGIKKNIIDYYYESNSVDNNNHTIVEENNTKKLSEKTFFDTTWWKLITFIARLFLFYTCGALIWLVLGSKASAGQMLFMLIIVFVLVGIATSDYHSAIIKWFKG